MEESVYKTAELKSPRGSQQVAAEFEGVLPGLHVLKPSADKETQAFTSEAKGFLVLCLVYDPSFLLDSSYSNLATVDFPAA